MIANTQLRSSEIISTLKSEPQYSPVESCEAPIGAKERIAITVAPRSGHCDCFTTLIAAWVRLSPFSAAMSTASVMTMALSTSIPSAMMNAPSEMRSKMRPISFITATVAKTVRSRIAPMRTPLRIPMVKRRTAITITTDSTRFTTKPFTASSTVEAWCETMPNSIPIGVSGRSSFMRLSMAAPIVITLPPFTVEMPSPTAGLPL